MKYEYIAWAAFWASLASCSATDDWRRVEMAKINHSQCETVKVEGGK